MNMFTREFWKNFFQAKSGIEMPVETFRYPDYFSPMPPAPELPKPKVKAWKHNLEGDGFNRDTQYYSEKDKFKWDGVKHINIAVDILMKNSGQIISILFNEITRKEVQKHIKMMVDICDFEDMEEYDSNIMKELDLPVTNLFSDMAPSMLYTDDLFVWYFFEDTPTYTIAYTHEGPFASVDIIVRNEIASFRMRNEIIHE